MIFNDFLLVASSTVYCIFGFYFFYQDRKSPAHWNFLFMCIGWSLIALGNTSLRGDDLAGLNIFWDSLLHIGASIYGPFMLTFILLFTGYYSRIKKPVLFRIVIWLLPVLFIIMQIFFQAMSKNFPDSPWRIFLNSYVHLYDFASIILIAVWIRKTPLSRERKQGKVFIAGGLVSSCIFIVSSLVLIHWQLPSITPFGIFFWMCCLFYAIQKYRFMGITPELVSRDILERIGDYVAVFDLSGKVIFKNRSLSEILPSRAGDPAHALTARARDFMEQTETLSQAVNDVEAEKLILLPGADGLLPIRGRFAVLRDEFSDILGALFTGHEYPDLSHVRRKFGLTDREIETAAHIVNGLSNRDIAGIMNITDNTLKTHIANLYQKLHITSKVELINYFRDLDLAN